MWRYVRARVPDAHEAEDVTSEVYLRAWRSRERFDPSRGSAHAWLLGIAHHTVADWWRRRPPDPTPDSPGAARLLPDEPGHPEAEILSDEAARLVRRAVATLTERERDALALRFAGGLKAAEVGAVLGMSEGAVRMLVFRAVARLRQVVRDAT